MSEKPQNVEADGRYVSIKAWLTHSWQGNLRHPMVFVVNEDGSPNYDMGFYLKTDSELYPIDPRLDTPYS